MATRSIHLKCQNCGANLDVDLDRLMAFCPYCGEKLLIDTEQLSSVLVEKEKTKQKEMELNNKIEYEKIINDEKRKNKDHEFKDNLKSTIVLLICLFIIFLFMAYGSEIF